MRTTLWSDNGRTIDTCDVDRCEGMTLPRLLCDQAPHIIDAAPRACDVPGSDLERERRARTMVACGPCSIHASSRHPMAAIAVTRGWPAHGRSPMEAAIRQREPRAEVMESSPARTASQWCYSSPHSGRPAATAASSAAVSNASLAVLAVDVLATISSIDVETCTSAACATPLSTTAACASTYVW